MNRPLHDSYAHCRGVARRAASSFYLSFFLLPKPQRDAMCALYAFLRKTDDIVDARSASADVLSRRASLQQWQRALDDAWDGGFADPLLPALVDTARRYGIPRQYLDDAIDGAQMDLDRRRYATFAELEQYCYRAASVVGLACIRIWGCRDAAADEPARKCGLAFQLTNILRDVAEDARRGRIYLPQEDLTRFGCGEDDILSGRFNAHVADVIRFETQRAEAFYREAEGLEPLLPRGGRRAWRVMMTTYRAILDELRRRDYNVFGPRIRFSRWTRLSLVIRGLWSSHARGVRADSLPAALPQADRRSA